MDNKTYAHDWFQKLPEEKRETRRQSYRAWYWRNREKRLTDIAEWRQSHRPHRTTYAHQRAHSRKHGREWEQILERDCYTCRDCGKGPLLYRACHIHHLIRGIDTVDNQITLCPACHRHRHPQPLRNVDAPIVCLFCGGPVTKAGFMPIKTGGKRQHYRCRPCNKIMVLGPLISD